jgi:hypothetical protein
MFCSFGMLEPQIYHQMKNNVLSAFVIFFAVVACLLIIDDVSHNISRKNIDTTGVEKQLKQTNTENLATLDFRTED